MMVISGQFVAICVLATLCALLTAFVVAKWAFQKDSEGEARKRLAIKLCATLKSYGLQRIPRFLECYAISDISGLFEELKSLAELFTDGEEAVVKEFKLVATRVLESQLRTEEGRALIAAKLRDATPATDPSAVKDGTALTPVAVAVA